MRLSEIIAQAMGITLVVFVGTTVIRTFSEIVEQTNSSLGNMAEPINNSVSFLPAIFILIIAGMILNVFRRLLVDDDDFYDEEDGEDGEERIAPVQKKRHLGPQQRRKNLA